MSIHVTMTCDRCEQSSGDYGWTGIGQIRADLRAAGWRRRPGVDLCPDCAPPKG